MSAPEHAPNLHPHPGAHPGTQDGPQRGVTLAATLVSSAAYALWLSTRSGRRWADDQTWATVVAGTALTLGWLAVDDRKAARLGLLYFMVAGVPIVLRSLWLQLERLEAAMRYGLERG